MGRKEPSVFSQISDCFEQFSELYEQLPENKQRVVKKHILLMIGAERKPRKKPENPKPNAWLEHLSAVRVELKKKYPGEKHRQRDIVEIAKKSYSR